MKQINQYEGGDLVRLKSGGPTMVVCYVQQGVLTCKWMNKEDAPGTIELPSYCVDYVPPAQPSLTP